MIRTETVAILTRALMIPGVVCALMTAVAAQQKTATQTMGTQTTATQKTPTQTTAPPSAVTKAFRQDYPAATITSTTAERHNNRSAFRVEAMDKGRRRAVLYDAGGTVIERAEQVDEKDLPKPVADAMHSHPRAIFVTAMKVTRNGSVEYRLTVRGTRKTAMVARPDGTVLSFK